MITAIALNRRLTTTSWSSRCTIKMRRWNLKLLSQTIRRNNVPLDVIFYKWNGIGNKSWHSGEEFLPKLLFNAVLVRHYEFSSNFLCFLADVCFWFVLLLLIFRLLLILLDYNLFLFVLYYLNELLLFLLLWFLLLFYLLFRFFILLNSVVEQSSSPVYLFNIIIVDFILAVQNLILFAWICIFQYFLNLLIAFPWLDHRPEYSVVEIIDVTINLSPSKVIFQDSLIRINYHPTIESRNLSQLYVKKLFPVKDIGWSECWY